MSITFRSPVESDRSLLAKFISEDPDHRERVEPDFFLGAPGVMTMVLQDDRGPCLFLRIDPEPPDSVRLHIQFSNERVRSGRTMHHTWHTVRDNIEKSGVNRIVFESTHEPLIQFCSRCFGFIQVEGTNDYELLLHRRTL